MKIKVWGCRGTLPTPGKHTLKYGGNTTCLEIRNKSNYLTIIDAGSGIKYLGQALIKEKDLTEMCLICTHSHWDHLMGFPFFVPAYFSRFKIKVCGVASARSYMRQSLARQLEAPYFPVNFEDLKADFFFGCSMPGCGSCKELRIEPIELSHPNGGFGYKFNEDNKSFVFLTDNELGYRHPGGWKLQQYAHFARDAEVLFHDAQYTDEEYQKTRTWGHSTYNDALKLALEANVKKLGLFHHDPERSDEELDQIVKKLQKQAKSKNANLEVFAVSEGMELEI